MPDPAPSTDIAALREAATKASPTPWMAFKGYVGRVPDGSADTTPYAFANRIADAALVVAAVNALPALLDEVERLRADNHNSAHFAQHQADDIAQLNDEISAAQTSLAATQTVLDRVRELADEWDQHWAVDVPNPYAVRLRAIVGRANDALGDTE